MPTESDKIRQNNGGLSRRQERFLPVLLASRNHTEACKAGRVSRDTLYQWLKDPAFMASLERVRRQTTEQAFRVLEQNLTEAAESLVSLAKGADPHVRRLAACNVLGLFLKHQMLASHEERIRELEAIAQRRHNAGGYDPGLERLTNAQLEAQLEDLKAKTIASFSAEELESQLAKLRGGNGDGNGQDSPTLTDAEIDRLRRDRLRPSGG
jgi:hypothetical protein